MKDKLWYYWALRYQRAENYAAGMFKNANAFDITKWAYVPDKNTRSLSRDGWWDDSQLRMTWQASAKNKFAGTWDQQAYCQCPDNISNTTAPESARDRRFPTQQLLHGEWFSPITSKILVEFVGLHRTERWGNMHLRPEAESPEWPSFGGSFDRYFPISAYQTYPQMIGVVEQNAVNGQVANLNYRGETIAWNNNWVPSYHYRGSLSYVTGTHSIKVGFNEAVGYIQSTNYMSTNVPEVFRFKSPTVNGVVVPTPNQVTYFATPYTFKNDQHHDLGLFAQDKWTFARWTLAGAIRWDSFANSFPEQALVGTYFGRSYNTTFPEQDNLSWNDITPRLSATYDVFGNGKTAWKISLNKYLEGLGTTGFGAAQVTDAPNPRSTGCRRTSIPSPTTTSASTARKTHGSAKPSLFNSARSSDSVACAGSGARSPIAARVRSQKSSDSGPPTSLHTKFPRP